ncbi:hypothetical protein HPP92_001053 [Vanilla planifolia]|nr:hypothetical protein HPP92_001053 [Vanilla planifolia]
MAASFIPIQIDVIRNPLKSNRNSSSFLHGTPNIIHLYPRTTSSPSPATTLTTTSAKFDLFEIAGGRGICNGEIGLEKELERVAVGEPETPSFTPPTAADSPSPPPLLDASGEEAFAKELMGLTGGFPGGEIGLQRFIEKNPPPNH